MKTATTILVILAAALLIRGALQAERTSVPAAAVEPGPDDRAIAQIYALVATYHRAASVQGLDLMMSLWADDAALRFRDEHYAGKPQIRQWFAAEGGPFDSRHYWIALTPLHLLRMEVNGETAWVSFETHYVDAATTVMKLQLASRALLVRIDGRWRIKELMLAPASLLQ